ncbi:TPA: alpha-2,3-sialyltransferase, partial [Campylobacter coli]
VKTKNQAIQNKDNQIATINNEKQKLIDEKLNLQIQINQLQNTLNTLPIKKQQLEISNLEQDLINKKLNAKETNQNILIKELEIKKLEQELNINQAFSYIPKEQSAKQRIQNQLSYKLGQAMIINSKSILGYIRMPFVLSYIKDKHKQEQKIYQEKIKKDPSLKLPPLESYPDYKEALKEKECLTYKLGEALIRANNNWYGGGYIKLLLEIRKLKREFRKKANHA